MSYRFEIFSINDWRDLENWVSGCSMSLKMAPSESLDMVCYSPSIVNMVLSCIISEVKRDIGQKLHFFIPPLHLAPPLREYPSEYCHALWYGKYGVATLR